MGFIDLMKSEWALGIERITLSAVISNYLTIPSSEAANMYSWFIRLNVMAYTGFLKFLNILRGNFNL